jgi:hypothetical protein
MTEFRHISNKEGRVSFENGLGEAGLGFQNSTYTKYLYVVRIHSMFV